MRIILITAKLNFASAGGSVVDAHLKALGLTGLGHEVTVVTPFSYANKINQPLPYALAEERVMARGLIGIQTGVYRLIKKYAPAADVIYIDGPSFVYAGGWYRWRGGRVPVAAFFNTRLNCWGDTHGTYSKKYQHPSPAKKIKRKLRLWLEHRLGAPLANQLDAFVFTTPMLAKIYLDWGFDLKKSNVIPDFTNTEEITKEQGISAGQIQERRSRDRVTFFCSGRMIPEKGFDLVIKAFALIKNKEKARLVISGGGPEWDRLHFQVQELGLAQFIAFPGWVEKKELLKLMDQADIFVFPRWWLEYTSVLLIEAMACGLPCIVPAGGGVEWLAGAGALTFTEDDAADLARQMERLGSDADLRLTLAQAILQKAASLDYKILANKLAGIFQSLGAKLSN